MTSNALPSPTSTSVMDIAKYAAALLLIAAGIAAYYVFDTWPAGIRLVVVSVGVLLAVAVFLTTGKGARTREFLGESRFELRKVVWPTRQETTRTMWVVIAAVVLISLILAAFDWVIQIAVKALLGS